LGKTAGLGSPKSSPRKREENEAKNFVNAEVARRGGTWADLKRLGLFIRALVFF